MIRLPAIKIGGNRENTGDIEIEMTAGVYLDMLKRVLTNPKPSLSGRTIIFCQTQRGMDNSTFARSIGVTRLSSGRPFSGSPGSGV